MPSSKDNVAGSIARSPIIAVVRSHSREEAERQARLFMRAGLELIEITFTVPGATDLVRQLLDDRQTGPPWIGMGTVTTAERVAAAIEAGAEFIVSPNTTTEVASPAVAAGRFLVLGALTCSEIVEARRIGADLVKIYTLPPVGGPAYLEVVRQPLGDIPMLAAGGFGIDEIPAYRDKGAVAFGIGGPLLAADDNESVAKIGRALRMARGEEMV
jgi:2-dehydro-3-deoxyphosphogluconate aldolase/(4S)-4-hydroxy-2-oxoglutarate aldolase